MDDLDSLHNSTLKRAQESLLKAIAVREKSLELSTEAKGLNIPDIDVAVLRENAKSIEEKAIRIKEELDRLVYEKRDLLADIGTEVDEAKLLLESGMIQQHQSEDLKADAFSNKESAVQAVKKADKILEDAESTLKILQGDSSLYIHITPKIHFY